MRFAGTILKLPFKEQETPFPGEFKNPTGPGFQYKTPLEMYESIPSFQVNPQQPGLIHAFPRSVTDKFLEDYKNPLAAPSTDQYIFNRLIHDRDQPFPVT